MGTTRPGVAAGALLIGSALVLSGCATSGSKPGSSSSGSANANTKVTYAWEQEFQAYNNNTADQNASKNAIILNRVLPGFWNYSTDGGIWRDTEFGTYEKTSDNPLTVKYTLNPKAVWSDGVPIDCSDMVLAWAANSGKFPTGAKDADGNPAQAFSSASTTGWEQAQMPQCAKGDKTFTLVYDKPFADWEALFGQGNILPAHIVEKQSGVADLIAAVKNKDLPSLIKAGKFYNTAWIFKPGQYKSDIAPSAGPYQISSWQAGQSITLTANPKWWGTPPKAATAVIRFIAQDQQAAALQNGEIQVMDPQPNPELLNQLKGLGSAIDYSPHDQFNYEHFDFNMRKGSAFTDKRVREAFTKCIPRQTIVDNLIKPLNPQAKIQDTSFRMSFQDGYDKLASANGSAAYAKTDIPGAKALLAAAGKTDLTVRIGYQTPNPRRTAEVALVRDSCAQVGFKVVDKGTANFFGGDLAAGNWDVALFAWAGSAIVTSNITAYTTTGGNNNGKYANPAMDALTAQLATAVDKAKQDDLILQIEKQLWTDLPTIPVFAFPALLATSKTVTGVEYNASQADVTWNLDKWSTTTAK